MTTFKDKVQALGRQKASLRDQLCRVGVKPLDSAFVERAMLAASLGLWPDAHAWRIAYRQYRRSPEQWIRFSLEEYLEARWGQHDAKHNLPQFGSPMPQPILERAKRAQRIPGVTVWVDALKSDDPVAWAVHASGENECLGIWSGRRPRIFVN